MTNHEDMEARIAAYADGELGEEAAREVESYLAANPAAQRLLAIQREATALLRSAYPERDFVRAGDGLRLAAHARNRWGWRPWSIAAAIAIGVLGYGAGVFWPAPFLSDRGRLLTELAEYHAVYSRETVHLVEVPAADSDHLRQWLGRRVKTDLRIPDLRSAGLDFAGGRLTVVDGEPVAELMYRRAHGLPIALCVYLHAGPPRGIEITRRGDQGIADWQDGTHGYAVVGEADSEALSSMAALARRQL